MPESAGLPDRLRWTREVSDDRVLYQLADGFRIRTEIFSKADTLRILPLGSPQGALMNHLLGFPEEVRGKRAFEPFAGSGALGLAALHAGAAHAALLDINPRAGDFQRENAALNGISADRFDALHGDIASFVPERPYDLMLANPPFVPTPDGIAGTLTSNGGPEGNRFVRLVFERFEELVEAGGRALMVVMQLVRDGRPLIADLAQELLEQRPVELTPSQEHEIPFATYCDAYTRLFPADVPAIESWRSALVDRYGEGLTLSHYIVDVLPRAEGPTRCRLRDDFAQRFGEAFFVPSQKPEELAFGRVFENVLPGSGPA